MMFLLKKYAEAEVLIHQQRSFIKNYGIKRDSLSRIVFLNTSENELFLHYKMGEFEKGAALARSIETEVKKIDLNFSPLLYDLLFQMAITERNVKNYKASAKWLNKILNAERVTNFRAELKITSRLLYLIVLFESHDRLFENRWQATKRFLVQHPSFKTHRKILEAIKIVSDNTSIKKKQERSKELALTIKTELKNSVEESVSKQFDFAGWIENKMNSTFF